MDQNRVKTAINCGGTPDDVEEAIVNAFAVISRNVQIPKAQQEEPEKLELMTPKTKAEHVYTDNLEKFEQA